MKFTPFFQIYGIIIAFQGMFVNYRVSHSFWKHPALRKAIGSFASEASYPSSTTMLVMCVMPTAIMQLNARIKNNVLKRCVTTVISAFIVFMVIGRLVSGVHWFTDMIGGALLSAGLVLMYRGVIGREGT